MNIVDSLIRLRDDLKTWVTNNLAAIEKAIKEKRDFSKSCQPLCALWNQRYG